MSQLEKELKQKERIGKTQKIILGTIAAAGIISVAVLAPNALQAFGMISKAMERKRKYEIKSSLSKLVDRNFIKFVKNKNGNTVARLTEKGEKILRLAEINEYKIKRPKNWDGKWRVIIFDIKEERKSTRNKIRHTLKAIGFCQLQKSVWVYPYDCEDFITLLKADFKIGKDLLYMIVWKMEYEKPLLNYFGLKREQK
jgi:DNA-binding transcriptional regulator PaaX